LNGQGNHAAQAIETFVAAFASFSVGGAMVWLDPERLPPQYQKMVTWLAKTERGRKRWGWFFMITAVLLVAAEFSDLFT
jgi:hypothetical protein